MLRARLITGMLLAAGLIAMLWADGALADPVRRADGAVLRFLGSADGVLMVPLALAVLAPMLAFELAAMLRGAGIAAPTWLTVLAAVLGCAATRLPAGWSDAPTFAAGAFACAAWMTVALALVAHTRGERIPGVVAGVGGTLLAFAYVGAMLGTWLLVRMQVGPWVLAGAVLTVKASDIGAYAVGMTLGRRKMIPWLSPGKSWEGFAGGIALASAVGGLLAWASLGLEDPRDRVAPWLGAVTGAVLGVVGPFGDLAESLLKRSAGVKDSGTMLPGMGGAFDVLDSLLLAGPVVMLALSLR